MIPIPRTPVPDDMKKLGVVQFAKYSYPNPMFATVDYILSMRGYELYTMESLKRDYKEWKEQRESPKKWQDLLEPVSDPSDRKFEKAYAKKEFKEYKDDLKRLPTLEKWAKADDGIGKDYYQMVLNHSRLYHLMRYGMRMMTTIEMVSSEAISEAIASSLERQYNTMKETARKNYVVLEPSIMKYISKAPRLPSWIVASC